MGLIVNHGSIMDEVAGQWVCLCELKTTENKEKPLIQFVEFVL